MSIACQNYAQTCSSLILSVLFFEKMLEQLPIILNIEEIISNAMHVIIELGVLNII